MRNINEYKRRFNTLLESTMGNVKPLISEAPEFEEFVVPTMDMVKATNAYHYVEREDGSSVGEEMTHKLSLSGNEYKITLSEGMYEPEEEILVSFKLDKMNPILKLDDVKSQPKGGYGVLKDNEIYLGFDMPMTQKELQNNSPFIRYADIFCKNVKGGILRFSVEVPSGSEIYEKPEDVNERDLTRIVRRVINEQNQDDYLPIKELVIGSSFADSYVILTNGEEYPVKYSVSKCPTGTYTQDQIPIDCNAMAKINGKTRYCNNDGCGYSPTLYTREVVVSRTSPYYITFDLKEPIDDFDFIKYDKRTGEILGNGEKGHVVARTQPNKDEDWVRDWFKRNKIKVF